MRVLFRRRRGRPDGCGGGGPSTVLAFFAEPGTWPARTHALRINSGTASECRAAATGSKPKEPPIEASPAFERLLQAGSGGRLSARLLPTFSKLTNRLPEARKHDPQGMQAGAPVVGRR